MNKQLLSVSLVSALSLGMTATAQAEQKLPQITVSGLIEGVIANTTFDSGNDKENTSDIAAATAYFSLDGKVNEQVSGFLSFLYEEGVTDFGVDEAYIRMTDASGALSVQVGQQYIPYGFYDSHMVNDPFTFDFADTLDSALVGTFESNGLLASAYLFNGNSTDSNQTRDSANDYGLRVGYYSDNFGYGVDYISAATEAYGIDLTGLDADPTDSDEFKLSERKAGYGVHAYASMNGSTLYAAYMAHEKYEAADIKNADNSEAQPETWYIEVAQDLGEFGVALSYNQNSETGFLFGGDTPTDGIEERVSVAGFTQVANAVDLTLELFQIEDFEKSEGGSGETGRGVALEFALPF
jgi:hypothetical protein